MKLRMHELAHQPKPPKMTIQSLEGSIYRLVARVDNDEFIIVDDNDQPLATSHPSIFKEKLEAYVVESLELAHCTPYEEMIGHGEGESYRNSLGRFSYQS